MHEIRFNDIRGVEQSVDLTQEKFSFAFNADCMDLLRALPDKSVVLACVDPPYGDASSQTVNVERERERETVQPVRRLVRQIQNGGTDSDRGSTGTSIRTWDRFAGGTTFKRYQQYPPPNCQNMVNPSSEPEEPGRRSTGKKS